MLAVPLLPSAARPVHLHLVAHYPRDRSSRDRRSSDAEEEKERREEVNTSHIEEIPGFEDVNAHGDSQHIEVGNTVMNANQFADYLRDSSKFYGQDLRLVSCSTGAGDNSFAQQLSSILHITVMAPDADTYYAPDEGTVFIGAETYNTGRWRVFKNGEELYE